MANKLNKLGKKQRATLSQLKSTFFRLRERVIDYDFLKVTKSKKKSVQKAEDVSETLF